VLPAPRTCSAASNQPSVTTASTGVVGSLRSITARRRAASAPTSRRPTLKQRQQPHGQAGRQPPGQPNQLARGTTWPWRSSDRAVHSLASSAGSSWCRLGPGRRLGSTEPVRLLVEPAGRPDPQHCPPSWGWARLQGPVHHDRTAPGWSRPAPGRGQYPEATWTSERAIRSRWTGSGARVRFADGQLDFPGTTCVGVELELHRKKPHEYEGIAGDVDPAFDQVWWFCPPELVAWLRGVLDGLPKPPRPEHHVIALAGELATVLGRASETAAGRGPSEQTLGVRACPRHDPVIGGPVVLGLRPAASRNIGSGTRL
jgi:hypothetical protein